MAGIKLPKDYAEIAVMVSEPLKTCTPDDMRRMLRIYKTDEALAIILAGVSNKTAWLGHDMDDPKNDEETNRTIIADFDAWWELEKELCAEVIRRLEEENKMKGTAFKTEGVGLHNAVQPFMERNGFRDNHGWWV